MSESSDQGGQSPPTWIPLARQDFSRFAEIALKTEDKEARAQKYPTIPDALLGEIVRYGASKDASPIPDLKNFYSWSVSKGLPVALRWQIYSEAKAMLEEASLVSAHAFFPFLAGDPDTSLVASASLDYVSFSPIINDDPMCRVNELVAGLASGHFANPGAVFGGLLGTGDPRVVRILWKERECLDLEAMENMSGCTTGLISKWTVDFYLSWMESLEGDAADGAFGILAAGLANQRKSAPSTVSAVMAGERPFPASAASREDFMRLIKLTPLEDYIREIAPRMIALERTEREPKVMPHVLRIWGLSAS